VTHGDCARRHSRVGFGTPGGKAAVEEQCDRLMQQIYEANKPQPHRYELVRALEKGRGK